MQMNAYLSFKGDCEEAFRCYERTLGGQLGTIFRYAGSPMAGDVPADWQDKVMHTTLTVDGQVLMGGDVAPNLFEQPQGFSMSITVKGEADTERIYRAGEGRPRHHGAAENLLGRPLRPRRRSLRHPVADQLRNRGWRLTRRFRT